MPAMEYESEYGIEVINRFAGLDFEVDDPTELVERAQQKEKALKADKKQAKTRKGNARTQEKAPTVVTKEVSIDDTKRDGVKSDKPERQDRGERGGRSRGGRGGRGRGRGRGGAGGFDRERPPRENREQKENGFGSSDNHDEGENKGFGGERRGGFGGERRGGFGGERRGFGGEKRGFGGERRGFGERKPFGGGFGNDNEQGVERRNFGGFGGTEEQQDDGLGKRGGRGFSRPRGRGRGRGGRGREFDRHSGSDRSSIKPTEKRDGLGSYNTGGLLDGQVDASEETNVLSMDAEVKGSWADNAEESEIQAEGPTIEEPKEMTLDEYKSLIEKEQPSQSFNLRQANEGEKNMPKNAVALKKLSEEDQEQDGSLYFPRKIIEEKIKTSGRVREHLPFDLKYAAVDSRLTSGGGGAGGRGRGRGRGARGGGNRGRDGARRGGGGFGGRDGGDRDDRAGFGVKEVAINEQYDSNFPSL